MRASGSIRVADWYALRPAAAEARAMLGDLGDRAGSLLGLSRSTVTCWRRGERVPAAPSLRAIWFAWCLLRHPERLQTEFDLLTWGRFAVRPRRRQRDRVVLAPLPEDWAI